MLRIVLPTDRLIEEDVLGKIILRQGVPGWPVYKYPARVSMMSANGNCRAARLHANHDKDTEVWLFTDKATSETEFVKVADIKLICDTAEEVNAIQVLNRKSLDEYYSMRDRYDADFKSLFADLNVDKPAVEAEVAGEQDPV